MDPTEKSDSTNSIMDRPIILSPPPLEQHKFAHFASSTATPSNVAVQNPLPVGHTDRQQSVGYNLQHEFETLTADLDLDLRNNKESKNSTNSTNSTSAVASASSMGNSQSLLAPSASKYGFSSDLLGTGGTNTPLTGHPLLRETAISPIPNVAGANAGIASLLGNGNSNTATSSNSNNAASSTATAANFPLASIPNRPVSVNDFSNFFGRHQQVDALQQHSTSFFSDLLSFTSWIENLPPQDTVSMIEYLCNNLPLDILLTFKSKLENHLTSQHTHSQQQQQQYNVMSPYNAYPQQDLYTDIENLNLGNDVSSKLQQPQPQQSSHLHQPKPKPNGYRAGQFLFVDQKNTRPKSAEPSLVNMNGGIGGRYHAHQQFERARSPTSHLYEKTNFLQLAAGNSPHHLSQQHSHQQQLQQQQQQLQQQSTSQLHQNQQGATAGQGEDSRDLNAHTALKLGALTTINSRVALDSNRKHHHVHGASYSQAQGNGQQNQFAQSSQQLGSQQLKQPMSQVLAYEDTINRTLNSSSVPVSVHRNIANNSSKSPKNKKNEQRVESLSGINSNNVSSTSISNSSSNNNLTSSNTSMPAEVTNIELLNNIPAWLKLLRLHKYTDCLKDTPWRELIEFDNDALESKGVVALGARRKLLKAFDVVKENVEGV
ncbi:uncharacterized protein RJT20DRAFT_96328 [Scheffersomyces xylosifermentans]|uniref:uncharacterized protein n=1 Tax=Scheffersomyces xylosifermentans TaxID=1304137 RepID=UPI00315DD253